MISTICTLSGHLYIFFGKKAYSNPFFIFKSGYLSFYCWFIVVLYIFWILGDYQIKDLWETFTSSELPKWVVFSLSWCIKFYFDSVSLFFSFSCLCLVSYFRNHLPNSKQQISTPIVVNLFCFSFSDCLVYLVSFSIPYVF